MGGGYGERARVLGDTEKTILRASEVYLLKLNNSVDFQSGDAF